MPTKDIELSVLSNNRECTACELHDQDGYPRTVGIGSRFYKPSLDPSDPDTKRILYLGRNPGRNEDEQGHPFVGRSGALLRKIYLGGINVAGTASVFFSNGVWCYTVGDEPPKTRHFKSCLRDNLERDLLRVFTGDAPLSRRTMAAGRRACSAANSAIVLLGGDTTANFHRVFTDTNGVTLRKAFAHNAFPHTLNTDPPLEVTLIATYHPAYVLRDPNNINTVHDHNTLIRDWIHDCLPQPSEPTIVDPFPPPT